MYSPGDFEFDPLRNLDGIEETESFAELVASLQGRKDQGLQPIYEPCSFWTNDAGQRVLMTGHRRTMAARIVDCDVPAYEIRQPSKEERLLNKLISNMQRSDLGPLEQAQAFAELANECGYKDKDIAARVGKSASWVSQRLALLRLAPPLKEAVQDGRLSAKAGYVAASRIPENDQVEFATAIIASGTASAVKARATALKRMHELDLPRQQQDVEPDSDQIVPEPTPDEEYTQAFMLLSEARNLIRQATDLASAHQLEITEEMSSVLELVQSYFDPEESAEDEEASLDTD